MTIKKIAKILAYTVLALMLLIAAAVATFLFVPDSTLRHIVGDKAGASIGREFAVDGPITVHWDWTQPEVHLHQIRLANVAGADDPNMVTIDELAFRIKIWKLLEGQLNFPDIELTNPVILLEKDKNGAANWDFPVTSKANAATSAALPSKRSNMPIFDQLVIKNGKLTYRDKSKAVDVTLTIDTAQSGGGEKGDFKLSGQGSLQNKPFTMNAEGGSLGMLRSSTAKFPLHFHVKMGETTVAIDGTFVDPVKMEGVDATLSLHGASMADLFYLTLIPLPPTPTYQLSGHLVKNGDIWTFENFAGRVGGSDLEGHLDYDTSRPRGFMKAELTSKLLDIKDLAGFLGATPEPSAGEKAAAGQVVEANKEKASPRLLPDMPLDLSRLRATDMDVTLKAARINAPHLPLDNMNVRFDLKDGVLRIDPLDFGMANGKIAGSLVLDGSKSIPHVDADLSLTRLDLKPFFAGTRFEKTASGALGGRFKLSGNGKSLAEVLGDGDGRVTFVISGGSVSQLLVDAAGLDVGKVAPILLGNDKSAGIRCAVADFGVNDGMLKSNVFVFDTTISNIAGKATVNLKNEDINGEIEAEPKSVTITAHMPIVIGGTLKHPSVSLDPKEAAGRAAGAAVLSIFLTPLAAVIPFIELGLGKDSDCNALINQARSHEAQPSQAP